MMRRKPELLCPAGDWERLNMAVRYGADAVYLAGKMFGMRAAAANFTDEELAEAVAYAKNFYQYIRIDTHEKNLPMQKALLKQGFTHRGTIYIADGTARMAFDLMN